MTDYVSIHCDDEHPDFLVATFLRGSGRRWEESLDYWRDGAPIAQLHVEKASEQTRLRWPDRKRAADGRPALEELHGLRLECRRCGRALKLSAQLEHAYDIFDTLNEMGHHETTLRALAATLT